jgi:hypothetical protein
MAKINSGKLPNIQTNPQSPIQDSSKSQKAQSAGSVAQKAPIDQIAQKPQSGKPAASSPLTDTLLAGLAGLAETYYGGSTGATELSLKAQSGTKEVDAQVSPELRAMKAQRLARQTGIPAETSQQIVDLAAYILTF